MSALMGYELYFGITNARGETRIAVARVWDGQRFMEFQREHGARATNPEDRFTISTATRETTSGNTAAATDQTIGDTAMSAARTERPITGAGVLKTRRRLGINQKDFWRRLGVTQSGGCRYESGERPIPKPVAILIRLAYTGDARKIVAAELRDYGSAAGQP